MKIDKLTGPGSTPERRKFWNSAVDAVAALQKQAGKNVSVMESQGKGTIINVDRKMAVGCPLPDGDCPHAICVEFMLDEGDTSDHDIIELQTTSGFTVAFYYEPSDNTWNVYRGGDITSIEASSPYSTWHRATVQTTDNGDGTIHIQWSIDGVAATPFDSSWDDCSTAAFFYVGGRQGSGDIHRTIRLANLIRNSGSDTDALSFIFKPDAFNAFTAGAVIDGDGNLRCDATGDDDAYATHNTAMRIICALGCDCCQGVSGTGFQDITEINNIDITYTFAATYNGEEGCAAYSINTTCTFNFVRIPYTTTFGGGYQFKLVIIGAGDGCQLGFSSNHFYPLGITCQPLGPPSDGQPWLHLLDILEPTIHQDEDCTRGTVDFCFSESGGVETWRVITVDPSVFCGGLFCSLNPGGGACVIEGIPWDFADMTVMRGTYSGENTCTLTHGSITISVEMVIS